MAALKRRTHPNPEATATWLIGRTRFVDELLGKVQAAGVRHRDGRGAQMLEEEPAQMTRTYSQTLGENFHAAVFQTAVADQAQRSRHGVRVFRATLEFPENIQGGSAGRDENRLRQPQPRWESNGTFFSFAVGAGQMGRQ